MLVVHHFKNTGVLYSEGVIAGFGEGEVAIKTGVGVGVANNESGPTENILN